MLQKGYREKSHRCLIVALHELYVKPGDLDPNSVDDFEMGLNLRQEADYALVYGSQSAQTNIEKAEEFLEVAKALAVQ